MLYELLSQQRSGSSYMYDVLCFYLESADSNRKLDEPFSWMERGSTVENYDPNKSLYDIKETLKTQKNSVIKNHAAHMNKLFKSYPEVFNEFDDIPKKRIILLRQDHFEKTVSSIISKHYGIWGQQPNNLVPMHIDPRLFRRTFKEIINEYHMLEAFIKSTDIVIEYEKLTFQPKQDFYNLQLTDTRLKDLSKLEATKRNKPKEELVLNLNELKNIYRKEFV